MPPMPPPENNITTLETARQGYVRALADSRWQLYQGYGAAHDHERLAYSIESYASAFCESLGALAFREISDSEVETASQATREEITLRREAIAAAVNHSPINLRPGAELLMMGDAAITSAINFSQVTIRLPSAVLW